MLKFFGKVFLYFCIFIFILTSSITAILSIKPIQKTTIRLISAIIRCDINVENVKLSWWNSQKISKLHIQTPTLDLYSDEILIEDSLIKILIQKGSINKIILNQPDALLRISKNESSTVILPFKFIEIKNGNFQIQTTQKNYKLLGLNSKLNLTSDGYLTSNGTISCGLEKGDFSCKVSFKNNSVQLISIETQYLPLDLAQELTKNKYISSVISLFGEKLKGNLLFDRQHKMFNFDVLTDKTKIKYDGKPNSTIKVNIENPNGSALLAVRELVINFDQFDKSSFLISAHLPNIQFPDLILKNFDAILRFETLELIKFEQTSNFEYSTIQGTIGFKGSIEKKLKEATIQFINSKFNFYHPVTKTWDELVINNAFLNFFENSWTSVIDIVSKINNQKTNIKLNFSPTNSIIDIPKSLTLDCTSPYVKTSMQLELHPNFSLLSDSNVDVFIPKSWIKNYLNISYLPDLVNSQILLKKNSNFESIQGVFKIPLIDLDSDKKIPPLKIDYGSFSLNFFKKKFNSNINGKIGQGNFHSDINYSVERGFTTKNTLEKVPSNIFNIFLNTKYLEIFDIENEITGNLNYNLIDNNQTIELDLYSKSNIIKTIFEIKNNSISILKPSKLELKLDTQKKKNHKLSEDEIYILSNPKIKINLKNLYYNLNESFPEMILDLDSEIENIVLFNNHEVFPLEKISVTAKKKKTNPLYLESRGTAENRVIFSQAEIHDIKINPYHNILKSIIGKFDLELKNSSSLFFKTFFYKFFKDNDLATLLQGADIKLNYNTLSEKKTINFQASSPLISISGSGTIKKNEIVSDSKINIKIFPNDQFKSFFSSITGINIIDVQQPFNFEIPINDIQIPLDLRELTNIKISSFLLKLDQILVEKNGSITIIGDFLKYTFKNRLHLWFSPILGSLKNGIIQLNRFDTLIMPDAIIAFWGKIDLKNSYVDCTLGITEQTLRKYLGVRSLPKNFVLTIPVNGKFGSIKIDKYAAVAKIASIIASQQPPTGTWLDALKLMQQMMNLQKNVPNPATPYPWTKPLSKDIKNKKDFLVLLKNQYESKELMSYSIPLDSFIKLIENKINFNQQNE